MKKEPLRLAVLGLLVAIFFGIITYTKDKLYDKISLEVILKVISTTFFAVALPFFILYLLFLSLDLSYNVRKRKFFKIFKEFLFDASLGILLTIIFLAIMFFILIQIVILEPSLIGSFSNIYVILILIIGFILLMKFINPSLKQLTEYFTSS